MSHFFNFCYVYIYVCKSRYEDLKFLKKSKSVNESKQTSKSRISASGSIREVYNEIGGLDVNFNISNKGIYILDIKLNVRLENFKLFYYF